MLELEILVFGSFLAFCFRLTVQKYNREIAVYEFSGNFFSGEWKFLSAVKEGGVMSVIKVKCH